MESKSLRILIVAEHASSRFGGEAFLPLNYFRLLRARGIEAFLLCHGRVEAELRNAFAGDQDRLFFVPDVFAHRLLAKLAKRLPCNVGGFTAGAASHLLTQMLQRRIVRTLVAEKGIDVVHEPIPVSPRQPSAMYDVGAPVVIGPMNGGMDYPAGFARMQPPWLRAAVPAARRMAGLSHYVIPGKRKAALLLVANHRTRASLPRAIRHVPVIDLAENGVDLTRFATPRAAPRARESVRFAFVGRLVGWKAVDVLIEALALISSECAAELEILGDGEQREALSVLARRLGVDRRVHFAGFVPQADIPLRLARADAVLLPSLMECGGAVVLEAMALGLPVIATRWGGPSEYLDDSCGILIEPLDRDHLVRELGRAMCELAESAERRALLGAAGRARVVSLYDWARKIDRMLDLYADVAGQSAGATRAST